MQSGKNPQQMVLTSMQNNPQLQQLLQNVNLNDKNAVKQLCKNVCMQKNLDYDTMVAQFKQNGGKL